jgi:hypothetical protein
MPGPYLIHPDKLHAIHNVILKQKARKPAKPEPQAADPTGGNIVLKLLQRAYLDRQRTTGRSF